VDRTIRTPEDSRPSFPGRRLERAASLHWPGWDFHIVSILLHQVRLTLRSHNFKKRRLLKLKLIQHLCTEASVYSRQDVIDWGYQNEFLTWGIAILIQES
jgi:hypothetical protein